MQPTSYPTRPPLGDKAAWQTQRTPRRERSAGRPGSARHPRRRWRDRVVDDARPAVASPRPDPRVGHAAPGTPADHGADLPDGHPDLLRLTAPVGRYVREMITSASSITPRRAVLLGLAAGLSVAAAVAIVAILTHSFDQTDVRLIATSLGFSVFSALGAAGAPARRQPKLAALGVLTTGAAGLGFGLLELAIWDQRTNWAWRAFGALAVLTLAASHASLVLSARRASDSSAITNLTVISVLTASLDAILALIAIVGLVHHISSSETRLAAVLVITMLLSTALPPILRRATPSTTSPDARRPFTTPLSGAARAELREVAHRLEQLAPRTEDLAHEIQRQAVRLRELADQPPRF